MDNNLNQHLDHLRQSRAAALAEIHDCEARIAQLRGTVIPKIEGGIEVLTALQEEAKGEATAEDPPVQAG